MKLNFKDFKKIDSDKKYTTVENDLGHKIKIAHNGLTSDTRKELEAMPVHLAKGGRYGKFAQKFDPSMKPKYSKPSQPSKPVENAPMKPMEAKNNYTEPQDIGTDEPQDAVLAAINRTGPPFGPMGNEKQHYPPCINPSCKSFGKSHPNCRCYGGIPEGGHFAEGGKVEYYCDNNRPHFSHCELYADGGVVQQPDPILSAQDSMRKAFHYKDGGMAVDDSANTEPVDASIQVDSAEPQVTPSPEPTPMPEATPNPQEPAQQDVPVSGEAVSANAPEPAPEQPASEQKVEAPATPVQKFQEHKNNDLNEMANETQAFSSDVNAGHIKPETYHDLFAKKDTLGKIGTLFGLIVGGAGAGIANQPSVIMELMNKEIQNDLQAQEQSASNRQNYLKINQANLLNKAQAGNINIDAKAKSYALARTQMNLAAMHKLVSDAQKLPQGSPQRLQAEQTLALMNQGVQNENFGILDRAATSSALAKTMFGEQGGNGSPNTTMMKSGLMGPEAREAGEDIEQKTIPGIPGRASRPIPKDDRDKVIAMKVLSDKAKDVLDFAQKHKGTINPATRAQGEQKAAELVNFYNQSLGGALTGYKLPWLEGQIGKNPTSVFQDILGSNSKLQEIKNSNDTRLGTLLQSYGMKGATPKASSQKSGSITSKSGRPMVQKDGKWVYQ